MRLCFPANPFFIPIEKVNIYEEPVLWTYIEQVQQLPVTEKLRQTFAAAEFASQQKRLILAEQNANWTLEQIDDEARALVYGASL